VRPVDARPTFVFIGPHQGPQIRIVSSALRPGYSYTVWLGLVGSSQRAATCSRCLNHTVDVIRTTGEHQKFLIATGVAEDSGFAVPRLEGLRACRHP
jgi:hypothetical protein